MPRKAAAGPVEAATKRDLAKLPADLAQSALGASALALARELDGVSSATSKSMCAKSHMDLMVRLRELAPPEQKKGLVHDIRSSRRGRLSVAGGSSTED